MKGSQPANRFLWMERQEARRSARLTCACVVGGQRDLCLHTQAARAGMDAALRLLHAQPWRSCAEHDV